MKEELIKLYKEFCLYCANNKGPETPNNQNSLFDFMYWLEFYKN